MKRILFVASAVLAIGGCGLLEPTIHDCCQWELTFLVNGQPVTTTATGKCALGEETYGLTNEVRRWNARECQRPIVTKRMA